MYVIYPVKPIVINADAGKVIWACVCLILKKRVVNFKSRPNPELIFQINHLSIYNLVKSKGYEFKFF